MAGYYKLPVVLSVTDIVTTSEASLKLKVYQKDVDKPQETILSGEDLSLRPDVIIGSNAKQARVIVNDLTVEPQHFKLNFRTFYIRFQERMRIVYEFRKVEKRKGIYLPNDVLKLVISYLFEPRYVTLEDTSVRGVFFPLNSSGNNILSFYKKYKIGKHVSLVLIEKGKCNSNNTILQIQNKYRNIQLLWSDPKNNIYDYLNSDEYKQQDASFCIIEIADRVKKNIKRILLFSIDQNENYLIGKNEKNNIRLSDMAVNPTQCKISFLNKEWIIEDCPENNQEISATMIYSNKTEKITRSTPIYFGESKLEITF